MVDEVISYDSKLIQKVKWLALNKIDLIDEESLSSLVESLKNKFKGDINIYCISAAKKIGTDSLMRDIGKQMELSNEKG